MILYLHYLPHTNPLQHYSLDPTPIIHQNLNRYEVLAVPCFLTSVEYEDGLLEISDVDFDAMFQQLHFVSFIM
jgi:hypothetical protein